MPSLTGLRAIAAADLNGKASPWRSRTWVWLGNVSFSFYVIHQLVIRWTKYAFGFTKSWDTPGAIAVTALILALSLAAATALYYLVELPVVRLFSGSRRRTNQTPNQIPAQRTASEPAPVGEAPVGS